MGNVPPAGPPAQPYGQPNHAAPAQPQYGVPAQPQYGVPVQPQYAAPAQLPNPVAPLGAEPNIDAIIGFPLQPGERVLHFVRRSYTGDKIGFWILGVLFAVVLIGIYFIYQALTIDKKNPRALALTNRRLVVVPASGDPTSYWFEHYSDLEPKRADVRPRGGGLIGGLIAVAVTAGLDALANRKQKEDPSYWTRTVAIVLTRRDDGRSQTVDMRTAEGQVFGPMMAKAILSGMGDHIPAMDVRRLQAMPAAPTKPGTPALVFGIVMFVLGFLPLVFGADGVGCGGFDNPFKVIGLLLGMALTGGGIGLCFLGARKMTAPQAGAAPAKSKLHPLFLLPVGLFAFGYGISGCWGVKEAIRCHRSSSDDSTRKSTYAPSSTSTSTTVDYSTAPQMTGDRLRKVLQSLSYSTSLPPTSGDWYGAPELSWQVKNSDGTLLVYLWDFSSDKPPKSYALGAQQVVAVEVSSSSDGGKEAREIASALAARTITSHRDIVTGIQAFGYRPDKPTLAKDPKYSAGRRSFLQMAKKGPTLLIVNVMDLGNAAARKDNSAVLLQDKKVVYAAILSGTGDPASVVQKVGTR